jgi:hypothetical protein
MRWLLIVLLVSLPLLGCASAAQEHARLHQVYRTGMTRAEAAALSGGKPIASATRPAQGWSTAGADVYRIDALAGPVERAKGVVVQACDVHWVSRGFMAMGIYWDYLCFDPNDRLVAVHRRFVD